MTLNYYDNNLNYNINNYNSLSVVVKYNISISKVY